MAEKKLPKNIDLAAGFFSAPATKEEPSAETATEKITAPAAVKKKAPSKAAQPEPKNVGGRPKKEGLKNEQFTLTMNPEIYEKLRIVANEHTRGNFSGLIDEAIKAFCREHNIDLAAIKVDPQILDIYRQRQERKSNKK
jgi:hypothetical protein